MIIKRQYFILLKVSRNHVGSIAVVAQRQLLQKSETTSDAKIPSGIEV